MRHREKENFHLLAHSSNGSSGRSPTRGAEVQVLRQYLLLSQTHEQGFDSEAEQLGLEETLTWAVRVTDSGWTHFPAVCGVCPGCMGPTELKEFTNWPIGASDIYSSGFSYYYFFLI